MQHAATDLRNPILYRNRNLRQNLKKKKSRAIRIWDSKYEEIAKLKRRTKSNAGSVESCDNHFWFLSFFTSQYTE